MTDGPNARQTLILWAVIARGGAAPAKDLKPALDKKDRDALVRLRLISTRQVGRYRSVHAEVTDQGWAWASANAAAPLPTRGSAGGTVLRDLLGRLDAFLRASGVTLAELIVPQAPPAPSAGDIGGRVREAYLAETKGVCGRRVRLATLRGHLHRIVRADLDDALAQLVAARSAVLAPFEDPTEITPADRDAALVLGGEPKHAIILEH